MSNCFLRSVFQKSNMVGLRYHTLTFFILYQFNYMVFVILSVIDIRLPKPSDLHPVLFPS